METINIFRIASDEVLHTYTDELATLRSAVINAHLSGQLLNDAFLRDTDLSGLDFEGIQFRGANLSDVNFSHANLMNADLTGAYLMGAILKFANLTNADLTGVNLNKADLRYARFSGSLLANVTFSGQLRELLVVPNLDNQILAAVEVENQRLDMRSWHGTSCGTTHCRAGWAVVLAGPVGLAVEAIYGTETAAALIYEASYPGERIPDFYEMIVELVLADIRKRANRSSPVLAE